MTQSRHQSGSSLTPLVASFGYQVFINKMYAALWGSSVIFFFKLDDINVIKNDFQGEFKLAAVIWASVPV